MAEGPRLVILPFPFDLAAGTAGTMILSLPTTAMGGPAKYEVVGAAINPGAAVASNGTDYITVACQNSTASGTPAVFTAVTTASTGFTAVEPAIQTILAAGKYASAGDKFQVAITHAGSGKIFKGNVQLVFKEFRGG